MTLTPELNQAVEKAGDGPVRLEDTETRTAYLIVREDRYRRMCALTAIDHSDHSLYEFAELDPDQGGTGFRKPWIERSTSRR